MKLGNQFLFWLAIIGSLLLFVMLFREVLVPFVVGITIAYLLNPLVNLFGKYKVSRTLTTILILSLFFLVVSLLLLFILPPLYRELATLAEAAPGYIEALSQRLGPYFSLFQQNVEASAMDESLLNMLRDNVGTALDLSSNLLAGILSGGRALLGFLSFVIITPLVAFLIMIEWDKITQWIEEILPRNRKDQIKELLLDIDRKIAGFVRGQLLVALSLGIIYALALTLAGLEFGFLVGLSSGVLSIIPLFGSVVGLLAGACIAWLQTGDLLFVALIAGIFVIGQLLEGNVITPKLLSSSVGLHPLWILFSLMAGAALFGIVGMMLAVPVAAALGVLINFAIEQYKDSGYYTS